MENKIATLINLAREYYKDNTLTVNFGKCKGDPLLAIGDCEWYGKTYDECLDEAIKEIGEWFTEDDKEIAQMDKDYYSVQGAKTGFVRCF